MIQKYTPKPMLTFILMFCCFGLKAQLPYFESFKNSSARGITFGGAPTAFLTASPNVNLDPDGNGYLRLTNNNFDQKGFIISDNDIDPSQGLKIQFEYFTYGGSGADGISFFLFDATANPFVIGGFGGSLGYSQFTLTNPTSPGVSKGYLGIGIDEYGNFSNPIEGRQGGVTGPVQGGLTPKSVTLRGSGDGNALTPNNYRFLTTSKVEDFGISLVFDGNTRYPDSTTVGYRRAFIDLRPNPNGGYNISVKLTVGGSPTKTVTIINNYYYPDIAPTRLRYGLASSTGNSTNFHEIRNVFIDTFERSNLTGPTAVDDQITECSGKPSVINVISNDASRNPNGNINPNSIDLNPTLSGIQRSFIVSGKGTFTANSNGTVSYNPLNLSVSGPISITYTIEDNYGLTSLPAKINIIEPVTTNPSNAGGDQLVNISTTTGLTILNGNSVPNSIGQWLQVTGPLGAVIINPNSQNTTVNNMPLGTFIFRWTLSASGQCVSSDDVQILINAIPVATNDNVTGVVNTPIQINIINNDTDRDGNNTIDNKTVIIQSNPRNGVVTVDPLTGIVKYTPNPGYSGPDSFTYTIKDIRGAESNIGTVEIIIPVPPKIGLAKALTKTEKLLDESFNLTFLFTITNYSSETIEKLSLKDDLGLTFAAATVNVISLKAINPTSFNVNNVYNGKAFTEMLVGNNQLPARASATLELVVNVKLTSAIVDFENTAFVEGFSLISGVKVTDKSTDGLIPDPIIPGDITPQKPTPIKLFITKIFIPPIISPNDDGINDKFVIKDASDSPVRLEVYNRWGNVVYKSTDYKNDWNGQCSEGIYIGQDLPAGTYYYIVNYKTNQLVGYLTLNR
jgi:gliding motility-associated-like protein